MQLFFGLKFNIQEGIKDLSLKEYFMFLVYSEGDIEYFKEKCFTENF